MSVPRGWSRVLLGLASSCCLLSNAKAEIPPIPDYRAGEVALHDVIAPIPVTVSDPDETLRLRKQASRTVEPIFRFWPGAAEIIETKFRQDFAEQRQKFLAALEQAYGRSKLNRATINHSSFARFVSGLQKQDRSFAYGMEVCGAWALGEAPIEEQLAGRLHEAMNQRICAEPVEKTLRFGLELSSDLPISARVVTVDSLETPLRLSVAEARAAQMSLGSIRGIEEVRREFGGSNARLGKHLASFLEPNCVLDLTLTRQSIENVASTIFASKRFESGETIVRAGETVDARAASALKLLTERRAGEQKRIALARERRERVAALVGRARVLGARTLDAAETAIARTPATVLGLGVCALLGFILWARRGKRVRGGTSPLPTTSYTVILNPNRNETIFLPVQTASSPGVSVQTTSQSTAPEPAAPTELTSWEQRITEAEQRAEDLLAKVRAGLAPELALFLGNLMAGMAGKAQLQ